MDIKYVKLVSGENLIAQVAQEGNTYTFKQAMLVAITPDGQLGMMPFSTLGKNDDIRVKEQHIIFVDDPDDEIKNIYNSRFGNGLVVPTMSGIQLA